MARTEGAAACARCVAISIRTKLARNGTAHVLTQMFLIYEKLRAQVLFCHHLMINDGQGANACQY